MCMSPIENFAVESKADVILCVNKTLEEHNEFGNPLSTYCNCVLKIFANSFFSENRASSHNDAVDQNVTDADHQFTPLNTADQSLIRY